MERSRPSFSKFHSSVKLYRVLSGLPDSQARLLVDSVLMDIWLGASWKIDDCESWPLDEDRRRTSWLQVISATRTIWIRRESKQLLKELGAGIPEVGDMFSFVYALEICLARASVRHCTRRCRPTFANRMVNSNRRLKLLQWNVKCKMKSSLRFDAKPNYEQL